MSKSPSLSVTAAHRIKLEQAIIPPQRIPLIIRVVAAGHLKNDISEAWLVGQEDPGDGYKIVMQEDGKQFGLASVGFPKDEHLVLVGWYGSGLLLAFLAM